MPNISKIQNAKNNKKIGKIPDLLYSQLRQYNKYKLQPHCSVLFLILQFIS